jgi:hypothetical protein
MREENRVFRCTRASGVAGVNCKRSPAPRDMQTRVTCKHSRSDILPTDVACMVAEQC